MKKYLISVVLIFIAGQIIDFILHGNLLMGQYEATANLWRPMDQMKGGLMMLVALVWTLGFTAIFHLGFQGKGKQAGMLYGLILGIITGFSMGFGTYSYQPITETIAVAWMLGGIVHHLVAGGIAVLVYQEK